MAKNPISRICLIEISLADGGPMIDILNVERGNGASDSSSLLCLNISYRAIYIEILGDVVINWTKSVTHQ